MTRFSRPKHASGWDAPGLAQPHAQPDKAHRVRRMFDGIAGTYELVNALTSFGLDGYWRRQAVKAAQGAGGLKVLDVACGTGDLARAFAASAPRPSLIVGVDFAPRMLQLAARRPRPGVHWLQADALRLPFAARSFAVVSCAFAVRNFQDARMGLAEMYRVLVPGGRAVIVEFSLPSHRLLRGLYRLYFEQVMPIAASAISRDRWAAYRYLPRSVVSFLGRAALAQMLHQVGFARVVVRPLTLGVVVVYEAWKPSDD